MIVCDYCGIDQHKVSSIVTAPDNGAAICGDCVRRALEVVVESESKNAAPPADQGVRDAA